MYVKQAHARTGPVAVADLEKMLGKVPWLLGEVSLYPGGVDAARWDAAAKRATMMLDQCADADPKAKMAQLRKLTKGAKVRIKFGR